MYSLNGIPLKKKKIERTGGHTDEQTDGQSNYIMPKIQGHKNMHLIWSSEVHYAYHPWAIQLLLIDLHPSECCYFRHFPANSDWLVQQHVLKIKYSKVCLNPKISKANSIFIIQFTLRLLITTKVPYAKILYLDKMPSKWLFDTQTIFSPTLSVIEEL